MSLIYKQRADGVWIGTPAKAKHRKKSAVDESKTEFVADEKVESADKKTVRKTKETTDEKNQENESIE